MTPAALDALLEAGASAQMIAAAWKAEMADAQATIKKRRADDAKRKAKSRDVTLCHADNSGQDVTIEDISDPLSLDKERSPIPPKEIKPLPRKRPAGARGCRLPDDWKPERANGETQARSVLDRHDAKWARATLETFTNHWRGKAGRDACKVDWQATWLNWVIEQDRREARNGHRNGRYEEPSESGYGRTIDAGLDFVRGAGG